MAINKMKLLRINKRDFKLQRNSKLTNRLSAFLVSGKDLLQNID